MFAILPPSITSTLDIFVSWFVKIALFLSITFLFPGIFYIVTDTLFYIWRTVAQAFGLYSSTPESHTQSNLIPKIPLVPTQGCSGSTNSGTNNSARNGQGDDSEDSDDSDLYDSDSESESEIDHEPNNNNNNNSKEENVIPGVPGISLPEKNTPKMDTEGTRLRKANSTQSTTMGIDTVDTVDTVTGVEIKGSG